MLHWMFKLSTALQSLSVMRIGERVQQEVQDPWMSMNFEVAGQTIAMAIATLRNAWPL